MNLHEYRKKHKDQLLDIMPIVRKEMLKGIMFSGLCSITARLSAAGKISEEQEGVFDGYVYFFDTDKHGAYVWPIGEKEPRLEWLDEQEQILNKL